MLPLLVPQASAQTENFEQACDDGNANPNNTDVCHAYLFYGSNTVDMRVYLESNEIWFCTPNHTRNHTTHMIRIRRVPNQILFYGLWTRYDAGAKPYARFKVTLIDGNNVRHDGAWNANGGWHWDSATRGSNTDQTRMIPSSPIGVPWGRQGKIRFEIEMQEFSDVFYGGLCNGGTRYVFIIPN
jgi:hypothetical protein